MKTKQFALPEEPQNTQGVNLNPIKEPYCTPRLVAHGQLQRVTLQSCSVDPNQVACVGGGL